VVSDGYATERSQKTMLIAERSNVSPKIENDQPDIDDYSNFDPIGRGFSCSISHQLESGG